uniref:1,4-alpha-glucan branching enzyme GlgB n=1 Tax=Candidatus Kentrum sp. DK TaxID=2126562 RepID=A0A450TBI1_9GAMM|nr:MAG: alpha-1,4-glucan:alpha-1,4-glucan 6-glycosyltransferase [Candidatus Kentron sp. DK]
MTQNTKTGSPSGTGPQTDKKTTIDKATDKTTLTRTPAPLEAAKPASKTGFPASTAAKTTEAKTAVASAAPKAAGTGTETKQPVKDSSPKAGVTAPSTDKAEKKPAMPPAAAASEPKKPTPWKKDEAPAAKTAPRSAMAGAGESPDKSKVSTQPGSQPKMAGTVPLSPPKAPAATQQPAPAPSDAKKPEERPDMASAAASADHKKMPPGIDAMALLKRSDDGKKGKPATIKSGTHRSAAEVIAKTSSRDQAKSAAAAKPKAKAKKTPVQSPSDAAAAPAKTQTPSRLTPKTPIPPEPKGPIGGVGIKKPAPARVEGETIAAILNAELRNPFSFFGIHKLDATGAMVIRVFYPEATDVKVLDPEKNTVIAELGQVHDEGLFAGEIPGRKEAFAYRLRITTPAGQIDREDPYRFPPVLSEKDLAELAGGEAIYDQLGAHPREIAGVSGVAFTVWAPNANRVAVVGDFNGWDGRRHGMRFRPESGVWEIFLPGVSTGSLYKYEVKQSSETVPELKSDPLAFSTETPLGTASIVYDDGKAFRWRDEKWIKSRGIRHNPSMPISFYEVHLGSWRRKPEEDNRWFTYREMADELVAYCRDMGFTHIALLPVSEYTYDDTVGYLPSNLYAPTNRYGSPDDLRYFVDACHRSGIGVVADWVPSYFSEEEHGLSYFDGTPLYEYPEHARRRDPDWNTPLYDLTRKEVANYLVSNALYWFERFHLDGLRISGLAKMFYLDYGRSEGQWHPNAQGGNENIEALAFIQDLNARIAKKYPGTMMIAEDSSLRGDLTKPVREGGLGFTSRWNTAWAYDTLRYLRRHPVHRKYYQFEFINPLSYMFDEKFVLPVSYDHVSIGQGSMVDKLPGDYWQKFATLRAWYALMYALPGKKLLFMGTEFSQSREWNSTISLDWHLLEAPMHLGMQTLIRDLNNLYQKSPALHELDSEPEGFEWIDTSDEDSSVISFLRLAKGNARTMVVVTHITPVVRTDYRIGVPSPGNYREVLNTDAEAYGGGNKGSGGGVTAEQHWAHGREYSICVTLPPYATVVLELEKP